MKICKNCDSFVEKILRELERQAGKNKRGEMIKDAYQDVRVSLQEGDISSVIARDNARKSGKNVARRLEK